MVQIDDMGSMRIIGDLLEISAWLPGECQRSPVRRARLRLRRSDRWDPGERRPWEMDAIRAN